MDPLEFSNIHSIAKHQKIEGSPLVKKKNSKKSLTIPKKVVGDPLVSPGTVLRGKAGKTFLVQFARRNGSI